MFLEIYDILFSDLGLTNGMFGNYLCNIVATLACLFVFLIPFIIVYFIIKRFMV